MEDQINLLKIWLKRLRESQFAHYSADERLTRRHYYIGIPAVAFSAIVGTTVFASLQKEVDIAVKIIVGLIAVTAAILTGIQTFWRFSERADRHRKVAGSFAGIRREIESLLVYSDRINFDRVEELRKKIDAVTAEAPSIPNKDWTSGVALAGPGYFGEVATKQEQAGVATGDHATS